MALAEEQISPEEKLLKVIQDGDDVQAEQTPEEKLLEATKAEGGDQRSEDGGQEGEEKTEVGGQNSEDEDQKSDGSVKSEAEADKPKPTIKMKKPNTKAEGGDTAKSPEVGEEKGAETPAEPSADVGMIGAASSPVVLARKSSGGRTGLRLVNWGIAAIVVLMLGLSGLEIFASVRGESGSDEPDVPPPSFGELGSGEKPYNISSTIAQVSGRSIFGKGEPIAPPPSGGNGGGGPRPPQPVVDWVKQVKARFSLAGRAEVEGVPEVVLSDRQTGALHFLSAGKDFSVELSGSGQILKLKLDKIDSGVAYITDGRHVADIR